LVHSTEHKEKRQNAKKPPNDWFTSLIAFFALIVSCFAAYYSFKQASIAEDTSRRQLRAYLGFCSISLIENINEAYIVRFEIMNYGQTPAKTVDVLGQIEILPFPLPESFVPQYFQRTDIKQASNIFPADTTMKGGIRAKRIFSVQEISKINSAKSNERLYVFLRIDYLDCFEIEHHTWFCRFIDPTSIRYNKDKTLKYFTWADYERFNNFD
jgi:hypothetical protein